MKSTIAYFGLLLCACVVVAACTSEKELQAKPPTRLSLAERPAPGEVRAGRIALEEERLRGGAADAAIGDYKIMNHDAVFVIHDIGDSGVYVMNGGALIDADLWRDGDSWDMIFNYAPLVNSIYHQEATAITVESDGTGAVEEAVIRVDGYFRAADLLAGITGFNLNLHKAGIEGTTYYRLRPDTKALEIETVVKNTGGSRTNIPVGDLQIPSDHYGDPFVLGAGLSRSAMQGRSRFIGAVGERNELTFGLMPAGGVEYDLSFPANLVITKDMPVYMASQRQCAMAPGETCSWSRYAVVAESPARAHEAVLAREGESAPTLTGRVTGSPSGKPVAGARVFVTPQGDQSRVLDMDVTDAEGRFFVYPGATTQVTLHARASDRGETAVHPDALPPMPQAEGFLPATPLNLVTSSPPVSIELQMQEPAMLTLRLSDTAGKRLPGKFVFVTAGPIGGNKPFGETRAYGGSATAIAKVVWQAHAGDVKVAVAPGTYDIYGAFGIEYELDKLSGVTLAAGDTKTFAFELTRAVDLTGWAQCDTHIHTSYSNHGRTSHTDRVITLAAEGLNCAAITDHDRIMDFQPLVHQLELQETLFTFPALEVSTFLRGHINIFSLIPDPTKPNNGAIRWWEDNKNIPRLFQGMRDIGARVIQINHGTGTGGFFTMTGYDPDTGIGGPEFSPKFDVMELMNGKPLGAVPELREIAFSLWDRGRRKTVVGVSDSHHRIPEPGYARTLVRVDESWHDAMAEEPVLKGFLNMSAAVANGVFAEMKAGTVGSGGTVTGASQKLALHVAAPTWVKLKEAELIWNGEVVESFDLGGQGEVVRLDVETTLAKSSDGWVVLQVLGDGDLWPVAPGALPYAMTNPIFIDVDGDGWVPPKTQPSEDQVGPAPKLSPALSVGHTHDH